MPVAAMAEFEPIRSPPSEKPAMKRIERATAVAGQHDPLPPADHGMGRAAELRGNPSDACPQLRRPRSGPGHRDTLAVAVTFIVDTIGRIDRATMRVVQAPGHPEVHAGYVPHIYTVSASARIDRSLPTEVTEYGAIVVHDVLRHVSGLRFRPGSRNGRPAQSMVLISCQVT
jgi:hypothetical protein